MWHPRMGWLWAALCLMVIGAILIGVSVGEVRQALDSANWQPAQAQISTLGVVDALNDDGARIYTAQIEYDYTVNERRYRGDRVRFGSTVGSTDRRRAERMIAPYERGAFVTVYYDPLAPSRAVVERQLDGVIMAWMAGGVVGVVLALVACGGFLWPRRPSRP